MGLEGCYLRGIFVRENSITMILTERQIRELIKTELRGGDSSRRLNEFKALLQALTGIFKQLGGVLSTGFSNAVSAYQNANAAKYTSATPGKNKDSLSPKTDAYDQVFALGEVLWHIDASIDLSMSAMERATESLDQLDIPVEPDDQDFSRNLNAAGEAVGDALGYFSGYLAKAPSSKVSDLGGGLEPGESLTDSLKKFAAAVSDLESLNPVSDWEKIVSSEAVENVLKKEDEDSENMKNLINDIKGNNLKNIARIGDLKALIDQANVKSVEAEQIMDVAAEETGQKPDESELLDHYDVLRTMIREIVSR
jgi:hypothetical protein